MGQIKRMIFFLCAFLIDVSVLSQNMIAVPFCKKCQGVIISEKPKIVFHDLKAYIPTTERHIRQAEELLCLHLASGNSELTKGAQKELYSRLHHSHRQYYSYLNTSQDTIILLQAIDFRAKDFKTYFVGWKKEFIVGLGDYYYQNVNVFKINLSDKQVSRW